MLDFLSFYRFFFSFDLHQKCPERESNPYGHHWPRDFLTTLAFTQAISGRCCSLDYFFTMPMCGLGVACIVSTPFISSKAEFSEPSPHLSSPTERFLFVRAILLHRFPDEHSCFVLGMCLSTRGSLGKAWIGFPFCGRDCRH